MLAESIFTACYGGGHAAALIPVVNRLKKAGYPVTCLALTTARQSFARAGIGAIGVETLLPLVPKYRRSLSSGHLLSKAIVPHPAIRTEETAAYMGVGFHSLVCTHGLHKARMMFREFGRQCLMPTDFYVELFRRYRPKVVIATSAPRSERAILEAARELEIPSICIVDLYAPFEIEWCAQPGYADKLCVLNAAVKDRFVKAGVPADRVCATGNPAFDRLSQIDVSEARSKARSKLGLEENDQLVVWISQPEPARHPFSGVTGDVSYPENVEKALAADFANSDRLHLVVRLHPSESRGPAVTGPRIRYGSAGEPLDELLVSADCIVTASSTVGLEAAILGVPVVQCMDSIFSNDLPLAELGVARAVESFELAGKEVFKILAANKLPSSLDYNCDGNAAARIERQVVELFN